MKCKKEKSKLAYATIEISLRAIDSQYWHTKQPRGKKQPSDYKESLREQGYTEFARCPEDEFKPDLGKLGYKNIARISKLISSLDESQIRIMTWMLANQDTLHQRGFTFGQRVYVNLSSPKVEYLDCYFSAYMLSYHDTIEGQQYFYITGSLDSINGSMMLMPKSSILNEKQFLKLTGKLRSEGKTKSPKPVRFKRPYRDSSTMSLDVPTIDTVKDDLEDTPKSSEMKKKKKNSNSKTFVVT